MSSAAYEAPIGKIGMLLAGADLSALQYTFVKASTAADDTVLGAAAATDKIIGVLQNKPTSGQVAEVLLTGISKMIVGSGGVTHGAEVTSDGAGKAILNALGQAKAGIALQTANAGETVSVLLTLGAQSSLDELTTPVVGVAAGYKIARGQHTMLSAADTVATGLTTVVSVVAVQETDPVLACAQASAQVGDQAGSPVAGSVILKVWMPTDATHPTLIAATGYASVKVNWVAVGT